MKNRIYVALLLVAVLAILFTGCKTPLERHLDKGNHYFDNEKWEEAITEYTAAIEIDPENVQAYTNRGAAYVEMGEYENGLADYNLANEIDPQNIIVYYNRSMVYIYLGEYDKSIADSTKIIEDLGLKFHWAYYNRAVAYTKKGFYNEALNDFYTAQKQTDNQEFISKVDQHIEEIEAIIWGIQPGSKD